MVERKKKVLLTANLKIALIKCNLHSLHMTWLGTLSAENGDIYS
jgi:hypothetical protein